MNGLSNLLQNKLLLQYLAGAGADIASGQPIGQNVNAITQQNIAAQNMMGLLAKMLAGKVPEGGKITIDNKGTKIQVPNNVQSETSATVQNDMLKDMISGSQMAGGSHIDWTKQENINKLSALRPSFGQPSNIAPEDLAGLTTADISQALRGALAVKEFGRKRLSDIVDALYKQKIMSYYDTLIGRETPSITIPGTDIKLTRKEFLDWYKTATKDERTAAIKNYEYALQRGFKGTFEQFMDRAKTVHQKDYEYYVDQERQMGREPKSFNEWMLDLAKAGGLSIGEIIGRKMALTDIAGELYFKDPKWIDDVGQHMKSANIKMKLNLSDDELAAAREATVYIENKIHAGRGVIKDFDISGDYRTLTWKVVWPSGREQEIRYVVGS